MRSKDTGNEWRSSKLLKGPNLMDDPFKSGMFIKNNHKIGSAPFILWIVFTRHTQITAQTENNKRQAEENARDEEKDGSRVGLHAVGGQRTHDDQASVCSCNCLGNKQCEVSALLATAPPPPPRVLRRRASFAPSLVERASV
ncbi:hypothetical protein EVAR_6134_1 [Eumeta japonica]|uniref:Uncharacterized protein n=1 Tax=Eumeta variegata TaxID=151549 RepID=A0A4C1TE51_EUMVA|nr:hypothetical protein EVAR_6134_1 [Eumeta japonica]